VVYILACATIAAASSATATCTATDCSSCVGTGIASVCVNYTYPAEPSCAGLLSGNCVSAPCSQTPCTTNCATACGACVRGNLVSTCVSATQATGLYLTSQNAIDTGFDLSLFSSGLVFQSITAQSSGTVNSNAVVSLDTPTIPTLLVGAGFGSGAIFEVNSSVKVTSWTNNARSARVDNNCGAVSVDTLAVGGSAFAVFQSCPAAVFNVSSVDFSSRNLFTDPGTVQVAGGVAHIGSASGTGSLKLSGGVSIDGTIPQTVTINVAASGKSAPLAVVDEKKTLTTSGDVQGDGSIAVNGRFELVATSTKVDPKVVVNAGATLLIDATAAFKAKAVDVSASAVLVIGANANKGTVAIDRISKCLGTVRINLATSADAFISSSSAGTGIAFTYSTNNVPADLKNCAVEVVDSNMRTYTLTSTTSATATTGRRLLASSGTATWGSSSMTYNMQSSQQGSASSSFVAIPIFMIGMFGLLL